MYRRILTCAVVAGALMGSAVAQTAKQKAKAKEAARIKFGVPKPTNGPIEWARIIAEGEAAGVSAPGIPKGLTGKQIEEFKAELKVLREEYLTRANQKGPRMPAKEFQALLEKLEKLDPANDDARRLITTLQGRLSPGQLEMARHLWRGTFVKLHKTQADNPLLKAIAKTWQEGDLKLVPKARLEALRKSSPTAFAQLTGVAYHIALESVDRLKDEKIPTHEIVARVERQIIPVSSFSHDNGTTLERWHFSQGKLAFKELIRIDPIRNFPIFTREELRKIEIMVNGKPVPFFEYFKNRKAQAKAEQ